MKQNGDRTIPGLAFLQKVLASLFLILLTLPYLNHASNPITFLTPDDGLSQGFVTGILQDEQGFIWLSTLDGLNRYDGKEFKVYQKTISNPWSLPSNLVHQIFEDRKDRFFLSTRDNGIIYFDRTAERFYPVTDTLDPVFKSKITTIHEDQHGQLWVVRSRAGLYLLKEVPIEMAPGFALASDHYPFVPADNQISETVTGFYSDSLGQLWAVANERLYLIPNSEPGLPGKPQLIEGDGLTSIVGTKKGKILVGGHGKIYQLDLHQRKLIPYAQWGQESSSVTLRAIDMRNRLWLAPQKGLLGYVPIDLIGSGERSFLPVTSASNSMWVDNSGLVWFGTSGLGVKIFDPDKNRFNVARTRIDLPFTDYVGHIFVDRSGRVLINNQVMDRETGQLSPIPECPEASIHHNKFIQSPEGDLWMATLDTIRFLPKGESTAQIIHILDSAQFISSPLLMDQAGDLWFANKDSLYQFRLQGDSLTKSSTLSSFPFPAKHSKNGSGQFVPAMLEDRKGDLWLGTQMGLWKFDRVKQQFSEPFLNALGKEKILSLAINPTEGDRILWVGTWGLGLYRLDLKTGMVKVYTVDQGLPNNVIYGILADDLGRLWMSTNRGISRFDPAQEQFRNYTIHDGLQGNEFNKGAFFKSSSGEFFFGGVNGLNAFFPEKITDNPFAPQMAITGFRLANKRVLPGDTTDLLRHPISFTKEIHLAYDQNMVGFEFAALSFQNPENNQYAYRLEGLDQDWIYAGNSRQATYTNLRPGQYTFQVKGSNHHGTWTSEPASIRLVISPPWWGTWWARMIYIIAAFILLFLIYRFRRNRRRLKTELMLEQMSSNQLKEVDRIKTEFFSNITHEFRTPLALILGPADQLKGELQDPNLSKKLTLILNNGQRLLNLTNQLLDISKLEAGNMKLSMENGDIATFSQEVLAGFQPLAEAREIDLRYEGPASLPSSGFDREKVEKILYNLFSNAIKFNQPQGEVLLRLTISEEEQQTALLPLGETVISDADPDSDPDEDAYAEGTRDVFITLSVRDTGPGIPPEYLTKIFDRFFQVEGSETRHAEGAGIGLALSRQLAGIMGGTLTVDSKVNQFTEFSLRFPLSSTLETSSSKISETGPEYLRLKPVQPLETIPDTADQNTLDSPDAQIILIVEDNAELRLFIRQSIGSGYQFLEAADGLEGQAKAIQYLPDLIISDVMMPGMSGFDLCKALKTHSNTSHIPIILLTAKAGVKNRIQGLEGGADAYLEKPFNTLELQLRIQNLLAVRSQLQQRYAEAEDRTMVSQEFTTPDQKLINRCRQAIQDQLDNGDFGVEDLCKEAGLSRTHLHRKLKSLTGQTTTQFVRGYRLEKAREMFLQKRGNVQEICYSVGFSSPSYFAKCFLEVYQISPRDFLDQQA